MSQDWGRMLKRFIRAPHPVYQDTGGLVLLIDCSMHISEDMLGDFLKEVNKINEMEVLIDSILW